MTMKPTREIWHQTNEVNQLRFWVFPTAAGWHKNHFIWHARICYSCRLCQAAIWLLPCYVSGWKLTPLPQNFSLRSNVPNSCSSFLVKASFVWCRSHAWILIYLHKIKAHVGVNLFWQISLNWGLFSLRFINFIILVGWLKILDP